MLFAAKVWSQDKLLFALDLIRHGDRTPIYTIPTSPPFHWQEGEGQLTPEGMRQEYQLGVSLRKKYIEEQHLLPAHYNVSTMYVRSTDYDRTLMSAESLLMGLYPLGTGPLLPQGYQPIPIHTVPKDDDTAFVPDINRDTLKALVNQYVASSAEWQKKNNELKPYYAHWSQATGKTITDLHQLSSLADTLYIDQLHHAPIPKALSPSDVKMILQAGKWAMAAAYRPKQVGDIMGGKLLTVIRDYLHQAAHHQLSYAYVLLSAHDSTILSVMSAMGAPLDAPPRYASDLNFALYQTDDGKKVVKVTFNGKPVVIPACHGEVCTLEAL